jgi:hypothetical protein
MNCDPNDENNPAHYNEHQQNDVTNAGVKNTDAYIYYNTTPVYGAKPKKGRDRIKLVRVLLWAISIVTFCSGWGLVGRSSLIEHFLNNTSGFIRSWGIGLMIGSVAVIIGNGVWGLVRWALRWHREK